MLTVTVVVVAVLAFAGGLGLGNVWFGGQQAPARTQVVVGTNTPFPPFEFRQEGQLVGLDVDLVNEIGARNNWEIIWRDFQDWDALLAAIKFRGVDVGASSITSNLGGEAGAEREASFDFSDSYYEADQAVLVRSASPGVTCAVAECTAEELANHSVAVQTLTTSYWWVYGNLVDTAMTPENMVKDFGDLNSVIAELLNGGVDWVLVDKPIAQNFAATNAALRVAGTIETNELYALAVPDGDPQKLLPKINAALAEMKQDGTLQTIYDKWFGA